MTEQLAEKTGIDPGHVQNILTLLSEGATIPFIARYRKERTGGATDEQLRAFQEIYDYSRKLTDRKEEVLRLIEERGHLNASLRDQIEHADSLTAVEDLYRPYKQKRNTRAGVAIAKGLEPLADLLLSARLSSGEFLKRAGEFVGGEVGSADEAATGAGDIVAERYSDDPKEREILRKLAWKNGNLRTRKGKEFDPKGVYARYVDHSERASSVPSHRYLAIMRAVKEKQLGIKIDLDLEPVLRGIRQDWIRPGSGSSAGLLMEALEDGLKRLLFPSIEREIHSELKRRSDEQAIWTFGRNLAQLLMTPPVIGTRILGVDPAYRSGCKLAAVDEHGTFLEHAVIYPTPPRNDYDGARKTVLDLYRRHKLTGIAIGNGTGCRETQEFFARINAEDDADLKFTVVSEAGASVYSASEVARKEYPNLDVTIRGAISIAHRLQNPMAALVKIDPQSLGIGQYQHDVDQTLLKRKLADTTEDLVNRVGVEVNSASASLLSHVAGVGPTLAQRVVEHREKNGPFHRKIDLKKVRGVGEAAFQQCSGFMRIRDGESVLDNTGVHPESYAPAQTILDRYDVA
ncbi:MAG: helix-hairpin-helix domain-containing protein, partial [Spirochaetales bacterium]|nr:helix-hairpin-helix domain-containing protein [Spirochaetales bacterium]